MSSPTSVPGGARAPETMAAVQRALAAEHAAEWAYSLVSAFLPATYDASLREGATAHRARRDSTERWLRDAGVKPVPGEPAYATPKPVTDQASAAGLMVTAETDAAAAWREVLERAEDAALSKSATEALTAAAVRATRWRKPAGVTPLTVPFPGQAAP